MIDKEVAKLEKMKLRDDFIVAAKVGMEIMAARIQEQE